MSTTTLPSTTFIDKSSSNASSQSIQNCLDEIGRQKTEEGKHGGKSVSESNLCDESSILKIRYCWVIVFASFICIMTISANGIPFIFEYAFTVPLQLQFEQFKEKRNTIQIVSKVNGLICHLIGPGVSALIVKFGFRPVCIAGSVVSCFAFILSSISTNPNVLILTYGVIGGIGFGMIYLPALVIVGHYFDRKRTLASGIAFYGTDLAWKVFIPIARYLDYVCNWIGYNLVLSCLILICALCGALMKNIELPNKSSPYFLKLNSKKPSLAAMLDLSLLKRPAFLVICFCNLFAMASFHVPFIYLSYQFDEARYFPRAALNSATESIIINFMARLAIGYIAYFGWIKTFSLHNMSLFISSCTILVLALCDSFVASNIAAYLFVLSVSAFIYLTPSVLIKLLGLEKFTNAFGWILFFRGIGTTIGLKLAQELYGVTKTIEGPLYLSSAIFLVSSAMSCFAHFLTPRKIKPSSQPNASKNSLSWNFKRIIQIIPSSPSYKN